ncbi:MAG TPA: hypothetical protein VFL27_11995 [Candidatus Dormibacteraeota bacterium]|nr:hypothetical protein [Candidatus Dormibacteraeota bacterium]
MSDERKAPYRFYSAWDNAHGKEVPMPWASCPGWDDPIRLVKQASCCGQPPIGRCRCGRWDYGRHAKHWGAHVSVSQDDNPA